MEKIVLKYACGFQNVGFGSSIWRAVNLGDLCPAFLKKKK